MTRNTQFSKIVARFLEKVGLISLWTQHAVTHTFEQTCRNGRVSTSTVDHLVLSPCLLPLVAGCGVIHRGVNLSVHSPIWVQLRLGSLPIKKKVLSSTLKKPSWSKAFPVQVNTFTAALQDRLIAVTVPPSIHCQDIHCQDISHTEDRDSMVLDILCAIVETSYTALPQYGGKGGGRPGFARGTSTPGWTEKVKPFQRESSYWHDVWTAEGRPRGNWLHGLMVKKRSQYHYAVRRARKQAELTRAELLFEASIIGDTNLLSEMKKIRCGGPSMHQELPDIVGGVQGEDQV